MPPINDKKLNCGHLWAGFGASVEVVVVVVVGTRVVDAVVVVVVGGIGEVVVL